MVSEEVMTLQAIFCSTAFEKAQIMVRGTAGLEYRT